MFDVDRNEAQNEGDALLDGSPHNSDLHHVPSGESEREATIASELESTTVSESKYWLGVGLVVIVALIWVLASFIVQGVEEEFSNSFVITYVSNSLFVLLLPIAIIRMRKRRNSDSKVLPLRQTARAAAIICPVWFLANFFYNVGLCSTSVTSSTILSSTSSFFTLTIGSFMNLETMSTYKYLGVSGTILGNALVAWSDSSIPSNNNTTLASPRMLLSSTCQTGSHELFGDGITLLGALFYATYTLLFRFLLPGGDDSVDMSLLFGCIGLVTSIGLSPFLLAVLYTQSMAGLSVRVMGFIILNSLLSNVLSDYLWARAVLLTSATVASVGLSLTIPLSMIVESMIHSELPGALQFLGALSVCTGFLFVNWEHVFKVVRSDV